MEKKSPMVANKLLIKLKQMIVWVNNLVKHFLVMGEHISG
jgi:hypothetical protein